MEVELSDLYKTLSTIMRAFKDDKRGAVTVDWVVLCAAIVLMVALVIQSISLPMGEIAAIVTAAITGGG